MINCAFTRPTKDRDGTPVTRLHEADERGATLVMVAISLVCLLGMGALAVDLAAGFSWRAEAQKIADSSALAGGSAFLDLSDAAAPAEADTRAYEYALLHTIKGETVDSAEVTVQVIPADRIVRVEIRRNNMPVFFSRVLGWSGIDISAVAAAQAVAASTARCLKPIALPDIWQENDPLQDDGDQVWEDGEAWEFDPEVDHYQRWDGPGDPDGATATGYGSDHRDLTSPYTGDYGRELQIKSADPNDPQNPSPGIFYPWRLPTDPNQEFCDLGGGGGSQGGAVFRQNLCSCNASDVQLGVPYDVEPGNMIGPTAQGVGELINEDPYVSWSDAANGGDGGLVRTVPGEGAVEIGLATQRVIKVGLIDPYQIVGSGMQSITFNNFALLFLEEQANPQAPVMARFLYYASGTGDDAGPVEGSLVRYLRLIE
jgi:hypothetical protein